MTTTTTRAAAVSTVDAAAQALIGAAARELHLPTVRAEAAPLAEIALRERQSTSATWLRSSPPRSTPAPPRYSQITATAASLRPAREVQHHLGRPNARRLSHPPPARRG